MKILIIGANGQIGTKLTEKLKDSQHTPVAMLRKEAQVQKFKQKGIETVLADLEKDISHAFSGIDAVVFTAGSGADTPKSQTKVIDENGAKKAIDEAVAEGINRFIMVSALMADRKSENWPESMQHYYEAKANADEYLRRSGLDYTILMPGRLTNKNGTGKVELKKRIEDLKDRSISREDVATVITEILNADNTINKSLDLLEGDTPIKKAVSDIR